MDVEIYCQPSVKQTSKREEKAHGEMEKRGIKLGLNCRKKGLIARVFGLCMPGNTQEPSERT